MTHSFAAGEAMSGPTWLAAALATLARDAHAVEMPRPVTAEDDATLADVCAAVRGDSDAYVRIIRRYQNVLARRMLRFTRNRADLEVLVHDTFVEAYFSLKRYRGDAPLENWLQRIATRVGYRFWKRQRSFPTVSY